MDFPACSSSTRTTTIQKLGWSRTSSRQCEPKPFLCAFVWSLCVVLTWLLLLTSTAGAQSESVQAAPAQDTPATQSHPDQTAAEIASHEEATTFKVNVKLVLVRVVVRDA